MKTPITYYGGKQKIAPWIIGQIPEHSIYVEPFAGGLAVFFKRPWDKKIKEVINDKNSMVTNFYTQLRDNFDELYRVIEYTPYSLDDFKYCRDIYNAKQEASDLEKARAFFVTMNCSFASNGSGWARATTTNRNGAFALNNKKKIVADLAHRMISVHIENRCALDVIKTWDNPETFFYCDPPYPGSDQSLYKGYTMEDFNELTEVLSQIKGKFMLSCYQKEGMNVYNFIAVKKEATCHARREIQGRGKGEIKQKRTETVLRNF